MAVNNSGAESTGNGGPEQRAAVGAGAYKRISILVGLLFITATVSGFVSGALLGPIMAAEDYLSEVAANQTAFLGGALAILIMGLAGAGIGISMYPVLRRRSAGMALGAAGFRTIEGALFGAGAVLLLMSIPLSQDLAGAVPAHDAYLKALGDMSVGGLDFAIVLGGLAFSVAALIYYYAFYRWKFIPRWLSVFGLIAVPLSVVQNLITYFSAASSTTEIEILHLPIFVQEMVLAVYLILKGFDVPEEETSEAA